jgi:hypothetical protein
MAGMFFMRRKPAEPQFLKLESQNAYRVRVKTARHGEIVEVRFTKSGDISPGENGGYFVRKAIVGSRHFDRATLEVTWGANYSKPVVSVDGGEAIPVNEWQ